MRDDRTFHDDVPSSRRGANGSPHLGAIATELARLETEQRRLRERQEELERELRTTLDLAAPATERDPIAARRRAPEEEDAPASGDAEKEPEEEEKDEAPKPPLRERAREQLRAHPLRSALVGVGVVAILAGGVGWYIHGQHHEETDDAQIDGDIGSVSPRVAGTITGVYFVDNQVVHAGDLLAELDARDFDAALAQAKAQLAQAEAQLLAEQPNVPIATVETETQVATTNEDIATAAAEVAAAEHTFARARADVDQATANARFADVERGRMARLAAIGAVAPSQSDQRTTQAEVAAANVEAMEKAAAAARQKVDEQRAKLVAARRRAEQASTNAPRQIASREATVKLREAAVEAARAQVQQAELNRSYARIVAPVDGIVGKRSAQVGDRVQPGQQLFALTQTAHFWVTANYRETQLEKMHPDQKVTVHVDALDLDFTGAVESMPGASGARYSLLPPENATGNYVKVVQRLPVRIRLDPNQPGYERLRPGMSVVPDVTLD